MAWELKIIHIDVVSSGDATLLVDRNRNTGGAVTRTRSMLIDGGRMGRIFWTYVVPVVPLLYLWDGLVSHLRTYGPAELEELAAGLGRAGYAWAAGRAGSVTYLLGGAG